MMIRRFYASCLLPLLLACVLAGVASVPVQGQINKTPSPGDGMKPEETAKSMKLPPGFQAGVFASEPMIVQPVAMAIDGRGRIWIVENFSYPNWKPTGRDRICVLEDTDGDGKADTKKVFWDKGNFITGLEVGFGGVWVGTPPNLLFIPDKNGDDVPDSEPVVLLDGWEHQDTHETLNSFNWGPDGWLYGCQGVFTNSKVGKPGTPADKRLTVNAAVWRYHPTRHEFEIFGEGGSNQWGVDFNDQGQCFISACVIPHLYHISQGGRYLRQGGRHNNPHTYGDIKTIADHNHFAAAYAGSMVYLGGQFPAEYRNTLFMNNIHSNRIHNDMLVREGSSFVGRLGPHEQGEKGNETGGFMVSGDKWYRGLNLRYGPDGSVFVNDWYDRFPCHQKPPDDQSNGRIYKISYGAVKQPKVDIAALPDAELVKLQLNANDWYVRQARRALQERGPAAAGAKAGLLEILRGNPDETRKLRALWALHVIGGLDDAVILEQLQSTHEYVRAWAIQCAAEQGKVSQPVLERFVKMAAADESPVVRLYLASAAGRLPLADRWGIVEPLATRAADEKDRSIPYILWYAIEPLVPSDKARALQLAGKAKIPLIRQYIARRATARE